jgi:hypothetical protein
LAKKIPVLTEVYNPNKGAKSNQAASVEVTEALLEKIVAQLKPQLETEITNTVLDKVNQPVAEVSATPVDVTEGLLEKIVAQLKPQLEKEITNTVLDEVKQPVEEEAAAPAGVTEEMVSKVVSQVKPRLEAEITDFVLDEVKSEINKARQEVLSSTQDFIDKSKADLKTELPNMYQESVKLAQVNLSEKFADLHVEASSKFDASLVEITDAAKQSAQAEIGERVAKTFDQHMETFQPTALAKSQKLLEAQLEQLNQEAQQSLTTQLQAFEAQVIEQHKTDLSNSLDAIHQSVNEAAEETMREKLSAIQAGLMESHQKELNQTLDGFLQIKGEAAEQELLQKMQEHQATLQADYQQKLSEEMANAMNAIKESVEESTREQTDLMFTQVGSIQQETFAKLREEFNAEKNAALDETIEEIKSTFAGQVAAHSQSMLNGDMPEVKAVLQENIQAILATTIPDLEDRLRDQLTAELQQLLLKVKFVLPD